MLNGDIFIGEEDKEDPERGTLLSDTGYTNVLRLGTWEFISTYMGSIGAPEATYGDGSMHNAEFCNPVLLYQ